MCASLSCSGSFQQMPEYSPSSPGGMRQSFTSRVPPQPAYSQQYSPGSRRSMSSNSAPLQRYPFQQQGLPQQQQQLQSRFGVNNMRTFPLRLSILVSSESYSYSQNGSSMPPDGRHASFSVDGGPQGGGVKPMPYKMGGNMMPNSGFVLLRKFRSYVIVSESASSCTASLSSMKILHDDPRQIRSPIGELS